MTLLGVVALAVAVAALISSRGPLAVVVDVEMIAAVLAAAGAVLVILAARRGHQARGRAAGAARAAAVLIAPLVIVTATWGRLFAYRAEDVSFRNGDVELAGTLFLPRASGPHPAVVMIHGSGRETRREYAFYARHFARHGVAGLAYDKRGVGESTGRLYGTDYSGYASDALAGVDFLTGHSEIDAGRIGAMGVSEGEWVAPLAAARSPDVRFVVVASASGTSPAQQVASEIELRLRSHGYPDSVVRRALALNDRVFDYQRTGEGADSLRALLRAARAEPWFAHAQDIPDELYSPEDYAWWRSVMDFDAEGTWERVRVPVLVLKGGRDQMSPADRAKRNIEAALRRGGNDDVTFAIFPNADHALLEWPLGDGVPPPVFAPGYLERLTSWVLERVGLRRRNAAYRGREGPSREWLAPDSVAPAATDN